ncbi:ATP-grasp fold amidoligase family protein [Vibrio alginolyticus]
MKSYLRRFKTYRSLAFAKRFILANNYIPKISRPKTYNEKVLHRKKYSNASKFSQYADKILVKDHVEKLVSSKIVIPTLYTGESISVDLTNDLLKKHKGLVLKANHNSGPVYVIDDKISQNKLASIVEDLNSQLKVDYGATKGETWYSQIEPKILIEERLYDENGANDLKDFKFHVFKQNSGEAKVVLHVDFDRNTNHTRSFFDEHLNWLPFSLEKPCIHTDLKKPNNFEEMVVIARKLAEPFSYARVDLYNVSGKIYFGEMTFAHGSGCEKFSSIHYDKWLGSLWVFDDENNPYQKKTNL